MTRRELNSQKVEKANKGVITTVLAQLKAATVLHSGKLRHAVRVQAKY